ncbi:hypothetical protein PG996_000438, partial [Apiospora saccharicola]
KAPWALVSPLFYVENLPSAAYASCALYPITVPLGNVSLPNKQTARGVNFQVGEPPQLFAFAPQWLLNNTFVYGPNGLCPSNPDPMSCTTVRGGAYDAFASKTRKQADGATYPIDSAPYPQMSYVADSLKLNDNVSLNSFPVGIALNDWGIQGYHPTVAFGLGANSTLLTALKQTSQILSRSWGLFWGRNGGTASSQLDGSIVFGGYDRAKVSGPKYVQALSKSAGCATNLVVTVSDMILNFPNGTNVSIFPQSRSTALAACIIPDYPTSLTLPFKPYVENFQALTGMNNDLERSSGLNYYSIRYTRGNVPYAGDLTIQLQSGLSVRVPNNQLLVLHVDIDPSTGAPVVNSTGPDLVINSIQDINANDLPQLGRQFLSAAYLMVNMEVDQFTLWSANPTSDQDLVAVDKANQEVTEYCSAGNGGDAPASDPSSTDTTGPSNPPSSTSSSRTGVIAGATVGGIAGVLLIGGVVFWIFRRRKRNKTGSRTSGGESMQSPLPPYYGEAASPYGSLPQQEPWQQQYKTELQDTGHRRYELVG